MVLSNHQGRRPWARLSRSGLILRSGYFKRTGPMRPAGWCSASAGCGPKCLSFSRSSRPVLWRWRLVGGAHYWARELGKLGHTVRLIPPAYVKPLVKRQKNDVADAEAICEAAQRPGMRFVPVKDEAQQANTVVFRARDLRVRQRTQCINALRGHLAEYGHVVPQGPAHLDRLVALVEEPKALVPESASGILQVLIRTLNALEEQLNELDGEIARRAKADPGLQPDPCPRKVEPAKPGDQRLRLARHLRLAHDPARGVDHANAAVFQRHVNPSKMLHGCPSMMLAADPFGPLPHTITLRDSRPTAQN